MPGKRLSLPLIMSFLAIITLSACIYAANGGPTVSGPAYEPPPPYTGVIMNHSKQDISFQSENSGATLVVPARGCLEFIAWSPTFNLLGYVDGKQVYCQMIQVNPKTYQFMCKSYDFIAEIKKEEPAPKAKKKGIKKKKKIPKDDGVEGFG